MPTNDTTSLTLDATAYLGLADAPTALRAQLDIALTRHTFLPDAADLLRDWVATVATPVFKLIRQREGDKRAFCTIGTGAGLDALAAIETLGATRIGITDVHASVVQAAARNITANLLPVHPVELEAGHGDLLAPLANGKRAYDIIYENLPNIPVHDAVLATRERASSGHVPPRPEPVPDYVNRQFLTLHYLALKQARGFLAPHGSVLSMLGARVPLATIHDMAHHAGLRPEIYVYTWKTQADPRAMLQEHAQRQREGYGPFYFYPHTPLAQAFAGLRLEDSHARAPEIEARLAPHRLDATAAWEAFQRGETIGHTVAVLRSHLN